MIQAIADHPAMVIAHLMPLQGCDDVPNLLFRTTLRQLRAISSGLAWPCNNASSISCPETPNTFLSTLPSFTLVPKQLSAAFLVRGSTGSRHRRA